MTLDRVLRERIFEKFGITDTGFSVPPAQRDRLVASCLAYPIAGKMTG